VRTVWRAIEQTTKTRKSVRLVHVTDELRAILLDLWKSQGSPIAGYILARPNGERVNLDNMSKRDIIPALRKAGIPWHGFYSLRRFYGTMIREQSGSSDTASKALGNSKDVSDEHYIKPTEVLPDMRRAVNDGLRGLVN
jgi:integrase